MSKLHGVVNLVCTTWKRKRIGQPDLIVCGGSWPLSCGNRCGGWTQRNSAVAEARVQIVPEYQIIEGNHFRGVHAGIVALRVRSGKCFKSGAIGWQVVGR